MREALENLIKAVGSNSKVKSWPVKPTIAALTLAGAWAFQLAGYPPCDLCYAQRTAFYVAVPVGLAVALAAALKAPRAVVVIGFALLAVAVLLMAVGLLLSLVYMRMLQRERPA